MTSRFAVAFAAAAVSMHAAEYPLNLPPGSPQYFSVPATQGNYRVTVTFGDEKAATVTTVKAELRRLMTEKVETAPGKFVEKTFVVNVRNAKLPDGGEVRLKPREKAGEAPAWDEQLTLEFTNTHPGARKLKVERADDLPTLFIAGDSTSTDQSAEPFNSWGQMITRWFRPEIAVANHGESGESLRSYFGERRWDKLMSVMHRGDYLMIQMGHNDQKSTPIPEYKELLKRMITDARALGVTPIVVTSMHRLTFDESGHITNSLGEFPEAARQVAHETDVALIDLNAMSKPFYEALGPARAPKAFADGDTTHHNNYGSYELAKCVVQAIKAQKLPLAKYISGDFQAFDPAHPDSLETFSVPAEPSKTVERPLGNE